MVASKLLQRPETFAKSSNKTNNTTDKNNKNNSCNTVHNQADNDNTDNEQKKPRHTPASRREATRRERLRVQGIRLAYRSLQSALNIPITGRPRYLHILQSAINRINELEDLIENPLSSSMMNTDDHNNHKNRNNNNKNNNDNNNNNHKNNHNSINHINRNNNNNNNNNNTDKITQQSSIHPPTSTFIKHEEDGGHEEDDNESMEYFNILKGCNEEIDQLGFQIPNIECISKNKNNIDVNPQQLTQPHQTTPSFVIQQLKYHENINHNSSINNKNINDNSSNSLDTNNNQYLSYNLPQHITKTDNEQQGYRRHIKENQSYDRHTKIYEEDTTSYSATGQNFNTIPLSPMSLHNNVSNDSYFSSRIPFPFFVGHCFTSRGMSEGSESSLSLTSVLSYTSSEEEEQDLSDFTIRQNEFVEGQDHGNNFLQQHHRYYHHHCLYHVESKETGNHKIYRNL